MSKKYLIPGILLVLAGLLLAAQCGTGGSASLAPSEVTFDVSVIEIKGATDGIAAPDVNPRDLSDGYRFKPPGEYDPDNPAKWQVSTYMFSPAALTVSQGDKVTLRTFIVNGDEHTVWLEAPDGSTAVGEMNMNRGREYNFTFTASQAGYYTLHCDEHDPTMSATILVLPTG
ncbi:MAG: plastocyanin/azurin family copper-binding protein [Anaerolineae bacterium]